MQEDVDFMQLGADSLDLQGIAVHVNLEFSCHVDAASLIELSTFSELCKAYNLKRRNSITRFNVFDVIASRLPQAVV